MSLLSSLAANPILREYAQNASQLHTARVADFIAPTVSVATYTGRYKIFTAKHRFKLPDTRRVPGGTAVRVGFTSTDGTYDCQPRAVDVPLDQMHIAEGQAIGMEYAMEAADLAAEIAGLQHEKEVIDLALATAGAGTNVNVNSVDPVFTINASLNTIRLNSPYGTAERRIVLGPTALNLLQASSFVRSRFVTAGGKAQPNVTLDDLSSMFIGKPKIMMSEMVYDTTPEGQTAVNAFLLDSSVLLFIGSTAPSRNDPSAFKTFRQTGKWLGPRAYQTEDGRSEVFGFDWSHDVVATNTAAVSRLNLSAS